jgi:hypothetical protein
MDWTMLGALGEFLGAIAVVGSLLYLAREVRQANRIARAEAYRSFMSGMADLISKWASDPTVRSAPVPWPRSKGPLHQGTGGCRSASSICCQYLGISSPRCAVGHSASVCMWHRWRRNL